MNSSDRQRWQQLLHAWELGMLDEEQRREFETLLLENDDAFREAAEFEAAAKLLRQDPDLRREAGRLAADADRDPAAATPLERGTGRNRWRFWAPAWAVAAALLVVLILKDWKLEFGPTHEATAAADRLAVLPFENLVEPDDPQHLGEIAANLITTDLSDSRYLHVVSSQRICDLMRLLGISQLEDLDTEAAADVAEQAGARWMLIGSILQESPNLVITSQIVDVASGSAVASQRVEGRTEWAIFEVVDVLTVMLKTDLGLPPAAISEPDRHVAELTTHSPEAYGEYLTGLKLMNKFYNDEARPHFRRAVELDSTFAMAWYRLALTSPDSLRFIDQVKRFLGNASAPAQHYIRSFLASREGDPTGSIAELRALVEKHPDEKEALVRLGYMLMEQHRYDTAIAYLEQAITLDPLHKEAYNMLAYVHNASGDIDGAIAAVNKYIELAPDEANPYDSKGDILLAHALVDRARASYATALTKKPDYWASLEKLGFLCLATGDYRCADSCFVAMTQMDQPGMRIFGRTCRSYIPTRKGQYRLALAMLDSAIAIDRVETRGQYPTTSMHLGNHEAKARLYSEMGKHDSALAAVEYGIEAFDSLYPYSLTSGRSLLAEVLARAGRFDEAYAIVDTIEAALESKDKPLTLYWHTRGIAELEAGRAAAAVEHFDQAERTSKSPNEFNNVFTLGVACYRAGYLSRAVEELERALSRYDYTRVSLAAQGTKVHYWLGRAYEDSRWPDKAIEQYQTYLEILAESDPGIAEVDDARQRLQRLRASSS